MDEIDEVSEKSEPKWGSDEIEAVPTHDTLQPEEEDTKKPKTMPIQTKPVQKKEEVAI